MPDFAVVNSNLSAPLDMSRIVVGRPSSCNATWYLTASGTECHVIVACVAELTVIFTPITWFV